MNITTSIEKIVVPSLNAIGYEYNISEDSWSFVRKTKGYPEGIVIETSDDEENLIRVKFLNSESQTDAKWLLGEKLDEWFDFSNEDSLEVVLKEIVEISKNQAESWFEENKLKHTFSSKLIQLINNQAHPEIALFFEKYQLDVNKPNDLTKIQNMLSHSAKEENLAWASYYFGELIIHTLTGNWNVDDYGAPIIENIGGRKNFKKNPYAIVSNFAEHIHSEKLIDYYNIFKEHVTNAE